MASRGRDGAGGLGASIPFWACSAPRLGVSKSLGLLFQCLASGSSFLSSSPAGNRVRKGANRPCQGALHGSSGYVHPHCESRGLLVPSILSGYRWN